jgi:hypothetical protein
MHYTEYCEWRCHSKTVQKKITANGKNSVFGFFDTQKCTHACIFCVFVCNSRIGGFILTLYNQLHLCMNSLYIFNWVLQKKMYNSIFYNSFLQECPQNLVIN